MNERHIYLLEKYLDESASSEEVQEFERLIISDKHLKNEYEEQKRTKEVLHKMKLKNPSTEIWDGYWLGIYNKVERGIAWIALSIGLLIVYSYAAIEFASRFFVDNHTPFLVKVGITLLIFGLLVLLFSVVRERLFTYKHDKYKEIQR